MNAMNTENRNLSQIAQKTTDLETLASQFFQQKHPLHTLTVDNLNAVFQFFPQNSSELSNYVQNAQNEAQRSLELVSKIPPHLRDFDNTFYALDAAETLIYSRRRAVESISKAHPDSSFRNEGTVYKDQLVEFSLNQFSRKSVYNMYNEAYQNIEKHGVSLSREREDYMKWKMQSLRAEGLHLEENEYLQVKALKTDINRLESSFLKNIDEDQSFILARDEELLGVPKSTINSLEKEGTFLKITCQYPHYFPVMRYCKVEKTRQSLYRAFESRAAEKNVPILKELIQKRERLAKLIGYASFAHLDISDQLAQAPETVEKFILSLKDGIQGKFQSEIEQLTKELPDGITLDENKCIKPWDLMYLQEDYKKKHYRVDEIALQQYFPFERTLKKIMIMFGEMFSLEIEIIDTENKGLWDTSGWILVVKDKFNKGRIAGHIILDPFPREGKFPHGYCFDVLSPCRLLSGDVNPAIVLLMVNFTPPSAIGESILRHDELVVLFHELGHAFHQLLGNAEMPSRSGYHIQRDALEWPSRLFEFLIWEKENLKRFGEHFETCLPIPDELIDAKINSKNATSGLTFARFFYLSMFSLKCFLSGVENPKLLREEIEKDFLPNIACDPQVYKEASFLHLAEHFYRSKFYAYFWADVFAFDSYEHIIDLQKRGLPNVWLKFRELVLDHGGGLNPNDQALQFLGRPPAVETYLKKISSE
ncbi:putative thimet oligopeptidase (Metallo-peptidase, clan ma(E), family m3) [Chlamydiales bacterium STE3]|nr:putative thimet oligopeptidase (Metallo-peptidase, clan ma(E), family m3) [Chlamydiales bacterium STE3]